jgi:hypothetical protein
MENIRMDEPLTLPDILSNAFNKDYTADQAVADLTRLMNEATLVEMEHGTDSPQYAELQRLIPVQEKLAKAKLEGHPIFDQLGSLTASARKDD